MAKPKENRCEPVFTCNHGVLYPCVYFKSHDANLHCKYKTSVYMCVSATAIVNAMVIKLKEAGFEIVAEDVK